MRLISGGDDTFDRTGVVTHEIFALDLPASRQVQIRINPETPVSAREKSGEEVSARTVYRWQRTGSSPEKEPAKEHTSASPDVALTTFQDWGKLQESMASHLGPFLPSAPLQAKAAELTKGAGDPGEALRALYDFVARKIRTVDLPLGATGFRSRPPLDIASSGYAVPEEKCVLLTMLASASVPGLGAGLELASSGGAPLAELPRPSLFSRILVVAHAGAANYWLDPSVEVAPFGMISSDLRGKLGLPLFGCSDCDVFQKINMGLPFAAWQQVRVEATLGNDGKLSAKVHYALRGDNELLLRVAFHQSPKEKWKDLAQLLSISDGFRGQVTSVSASDPYATHDPFTLEYEITMPKFVDWSKKPVRIPALLPQLGLPEPPAKPAAGAATSPIELGTPLEVETHMTLQLPPGTTALTPTGTSVQRDYATFASHYEAKGSTITASRHINFILREVSAERAADYNAFLRAVQSDEAQDFTLERANSEAARPQLAGEKPPR